MKRTTIGLAAVLAVCGGPLHAAPAPGLGGALTPQTGPGQKPLPPPPYASPQPPLMSPEVPRAARPPADQGETVTFGDVVVHAESHGRPARARGRWQAPAATAAELGLDVAPGQAMDAAWVRRQFTLNHLVGSATTPDRIVALVLMINQAYARFGYINSGVVFARQDWSVSRTLELRLIAGGLKPGPDGRPAVSVTWARGGAMGLSPSFILQRLPSATRTPLNVIDLEHDFRLLADDPALQTINAELMPGAEAGEATLALTAKPQPWVDVYAGVANSRNPSVGPIRYDVGGMLRNVLEGGDTVTFDGGVTSGLTDGVVDYATPFLVPWATADLQASYDDAAVVDPSVRKLNIRSEETDVDGGIAAQLLSQPLTPNGESWSPAQSLQLGLRVAQRRSSSTLLGTPFSFSPGSVDGITDLTVMRGVATYIRRSQTSALAVSATLSAGLAGSGSDVLSVARPDPHFRSLLVQANYARRLAAGLELRARFTGQWANDTLYAMERLSVGGADTVRGYRENLLLSDGGEVGSVELACPITPTKSLCDAASDWTTVRFSVFADGAYVRNEVAPQPAPQGIGSVGVSALWSPSAAFSARLTYGYALVHVSQSGPPDLEDKGVSFAVTLYPLQMTHAFR